MLTTHHLAHLHHHRGSTAVELDKITNLSTHIASKSLRYCLQTSYMAHSKHSSEQRTDSASEDVLTDNPHQVLLFYLAQCFLHELIKNYIQVVLMDMSGFNENCAGPSNLGNVISQILLCKQIRPDFSQIELSSITKDSQDIAVLLSEI
ncbi:uncharacterized protein LOC118742039 [Rhagoletis pomonella]|uniref:uncharacterized protein LOC118742039 n=1 Tax=Rhagoletis pomonella TaxID=28610 RepID=UPI001786C02D|nr:uncharacterized protein LOC118742039 [Rhagoletis pomonella]